MTDLQTPAPEAHPMAETHETLTAEELAASEAWARKWSRDCQSAAVLPTASPHTVLRLHANINALTAEVERLREALNRAAEIAEKWGDVHRIKTAKKRFTVYDMEYMVRSAGLLIGEDIRAALTPEARNV